MIHFKEMAQARVVAKPEGMESLNERIVLEDGTEAGKLGYKNMYLKSDVEQVYLDLSQRRQNLFEAMIDEFEEFPMVGKTFRVSIIRIDRGYADTGFLVEVSHE